LHSRVRLAGGGVAGGWGGFEQRQGGGKNAFGPEAALAGVEPEDGRAQIVEWWRVEKFAEKIVDALLEGTIFRAETVGGNFESDRRDADEK